MSLMFEVDGKALPADDCSWLLIAPCGCPCGITVIGRGDDVLATAEQAMKAFVPNAEQRRRDAKAGWKVRLGLRKEVHQLVDDCKHTPRWGVEKTPIPEGHVWARQVVSVRRGNGRRKHLVPVIGVENRSEGRYGAGETPALCGSSTWHWSDKWWDVNDYPECVRCQRAARALPSIASTPGTDGAPAVVTVELPPFTEEGQR
ncbi:hypothetical protein [Amycolatopsis thermophila]|uniref:Uncharacterized protein n=1 Tax=Amycolatopsis thermophila TaxID=206084 RepID=A0ABU0ERJ6_9PSEU|nr:hypothetical protein [Amycolatopsis thermophila]MDQ0377925.1 hypothetical protein [Amycolatopsis thermophila]